MRDVSMHRRCREVVMARADPGRMVIMGMSNRGRTVLAARRTTLRHPTPFAGGIALYPGCRSDAAGGSYAPLLVLIGRGDTATPARFCEEMKARQTGASAEVTLVTYPRAPHTFDMPLPDRTLLGMRLGFDGEATADARRQVIAFLTVRGLIPGLLSC